MTYDPFGDDPDADIFSEDSEEQLDEAHDADLDESINHKHTIDGTICPTCNETHPQGFAEDLPPEDVESMLTFLDALPGEVGRAIINYQGTEKKKPQAEVLTAFLKFSERMDRSNSLGPLLRSIVEHLDEQTDGRISAKWRIYEAERRLITTHRILKSANTALDDARMSEAPKGYIGLLEILLDFMEERLSLLKLKYKNACKDIDYPPVEEILEYGKYPPGEEKSTEKIISDELYRELIIR